MTVKIDQALIATVMAGGLALDVVHENGLYSVWGGTAYANTKGAYTPTATRAFIEIRNFPADVAAYSLNDSDSHAGVFQGIVKYPADTGAPTAKEKAEQFLALFRIGSFVEYSGQKVFVQTKSRDGGRIDGGFYQIVCRVEYNAFVTR